MFIYQWYWVPLVLIYIAIIITILIENRHPSKTIAWILVIVFLPVAGILIYYVFGQQYKKEQRLRRQDKEKHIRLMRVWDRLTPIVEENLAHLRR